MNPSPPAPSRFGPPKEDGPRFTLASSVTRGGLGFAAVSLAAFSVWAFAGQWLSANVREAGFYAAVAIVFVALSGLVLHPLVRGPGSIRRFYKAFVPAFAAYAVVWSLLWFALQSRLGEWLGSLGGSVAFAALIGRALGTLRPLAKVSAVLFLAHSVGYFMGGDFYYWSKAPAAVELLGGISRTLGRLGWGLFYGLGFGAGLGYAFFSFQNEPPKPDVTGQ